MDHITCVESVKNEIRTKLRRQLGQRVETASPLQIYQAVALTVRDRVMENWQLSNEHMAKSKCKTLYYLSLEFLTGKFLGSNLTALGAYPLYSEALAGLGLNLRDIEDTEPEPGLGSGGLGRLAACYLESLSTMALPAIGCGIRYDLGLFRQKIVNGEQTELPDNWLENGCVWEAPVPEDAVEVLFNGRVIEYYDENGIMRHRLEDCTRVIAVPYDIPVCGYGNGFCNTLRLWSARPPEYINLRYFSEGDYVRANAEKALAESISKMLYPNDSHNAGKSLRLRQQYFFTAATLSYMLKRHKAMGLPLGALKDKVAIQINDTHPSLAIAELMRLLVDMEGLGWDEAWDICTSVFSYTNHTVMSEALEVWPVSLLESLLPRIMMIIREIDRRLRLRVSARFGEHNSPALDKTAIISRGHVRMANLCAASSKKVNGVSGLHTEILRAKLFPEFDTLDPGKIIPITNGVSPRRWLLQTNPELSSLIRGALGSDGFATDLSRLAGLEKYASDPGFRSGIEAVKRKNKGRLSDYLMKTSGVSVDPDAIFDVHIKRMHEYKRQLLNALHILYLYRGIKNGVYPERPITFIFGAKASPGYARAKQIISLINGISRLIGADPAASKYLKVVFVENYSVSSAAVIIPAADISEQISLAGKEASGTGNMKLMLNGALTIGTKDGANVEMLELLGPDNIFIFGLDAAGVEAAFRYGRKTPEQLCAEDERLRETVFSLGGGAFSSSGGALMNYLLYGDGGMPDPYLCLTDFQSYAKTHTALTALYENRTEWLKKEIINISRSGFFSSDRSIAEYNQKIWGL